MADQTAITTNFSQETIEKTRHYMGQQQAAAAARSAVTAKQMLDEIARHIKPGVKESEIQAFSKNLFKENGLRTWHLPYVRFANHTLLTFKDKTTDDYILQENDIAFVDIGIVEEEIEGDIGDTYVFGIQHEHVRLQQAARTIFRDAENHWHTTNCTGIELYKHILATAEKLDVLFNLDPAGHLIGTFPHRGWKEGLNHYPEPVLPGTWILEIQIKHPRLPYGAFYEDLLLKDYVKMINNHERQ